MVIFDLWVTQLSITNTKFYIFYLRKLFWSINSIIKIKKSKLLTDGSKNLKPIKLSSEIAAIQLTPIEFGLLNKIGVLFLK